MGGGGVGVSPQLEQVVQKMVEEVDVEQSTIHDEVEQKVVGLQGTSGKTE